MKTKLIVIAALVSVGILRTQAQIVQQPQAIPAVTTIVAPIPFGQTLDVIPYVSADGYTIQMHVLPSFTEFLGYDTEAARQFRTVVSGVPVQDTPLPRFRVRQVATSAIVRRFLCSAIFRSWDDCSAAKRRTAPRKIWSFL